MATMSELATKYTKLSEAEIDWLNLLVPDMPLLADLSFGDLVLWAPTEEGEYLAISHSRASSTVTLFYRDVVGDYLREDWRDLIEETLETNQPAVSTAPAWYEENPMRLSAYSIRRFDESGNLTKPFAVLTVHTSHSVEFSASRQIVAFKECAEELCGMVQNGLFPTADFEPTTAQGAPRASDGLIRVNEDGDITFASPNSQTIFGRLGFRDELEGERLADVVADLVLGQQDTNESLPLIAQARTSRRADIEVRGVTVTLRSIPTFVSGERAGGIILTRDISAIKEHEQMLITKDATIREIHHRVKNNLQTVASLLRVQARRAKSEEAKEALSQAMRRVAAIAVVHDTLSTGLAQTVDFDEVFDQVIKLAAEVASIHNTVVHLKKEGSFGSLPSEYATPLSLALTEVVTNAVEHGLREIEGTVSISAERTDEYLHVNVEDTGAGLPGGQVGDGLGTQIVKTLIEGELGGSIKWQNSAETGGTLVTIRIPLHWITAD